VTPKGVKTFAFAYRDKGTSKVKWITLGRYPDLPLVSARELANSAQKLAPIAGRVGRPHAPCRNAPLAGRKQADHR
jgi:hypothetical protein